MESKGVEVVMLNGVSFKHFIPLFDEDNQLIFKGVIITDKDRKTLDDAESDTFKKLESKENKNLKVCGAEVTLEYDLITCNPDKSFIREVFNKIHPKIFKNVFNNSDEEICNIMNESKNSIKKSRIAWILSTELKKDKNIEYLVPTYINTALEFICKK